MSEFLRFLYLVHSGKSEMSVSFATAQTILLYYFEPSQYICTYGGTHLHIALCWFALPHTHTQEFHMAEDQVESRLTPRRQVTYFYPTAVDSCCYTTHIISENEPWPLNERHNVQWLFILK